MGGGGGGGGGGTRCFSICFIYITFLFNFDISRQVTAEQHIHILTPCDCLRKGEGAQKGERAQCFGILLTLGHWSVGAAEELGDVGRGRGEAERGRW